MTACFGEALRPLGQIRIVNEGVRKSLVANNQAAGSVAVEQKIGGSVYHARHQARAFLRLFFLQSFFGESGAQFRVFAFQQRYFVLNSLEPSGQFLITAILIGEISFNDNQALDFPLIIPNTHGVHAKETVYSVAAVQPAFQAEGVFRAFEEAAAKFKAFGVVVWMVQFQPLVQRLGQGRGVRRRPCMSEAEHRISFVSKYMSRTQSSVFRKNACQIGSFLKEFFASVSTISLISSAFQMQVFEKIITHTRRLIVIVLRRKFIELYNNFLKGSAFTITR
jgi:hypothetical protein